MYTKIKFSRLTDGYEHKLISSTGKPKKEYIGHIGNVIHTCIISKGNYVKPTLYDVQFDDGAIFCLDEDQIEFVALGALEPNLSISFEKCTIELDQKISSAKVVLSLLGLKHNLWKIRVKKRRILRPEKYKKFLVQKKCLRAFIQGLCERFEFWKII